MIQIDRVTASHSPATKTYTLKLDFVACEGKLAYLAHLKNYPLYNLNAKGEKSFLKYNCLLDNYCQANIDDIFFSDNLVVKNYRESMDEDKTLYIEFGEEEGVMSVNMIEIDRISVMHPYPTEFELRLIFATIEDKLLYKDHLRSMNSNSVESEKMFIKHHCAYPLDDVILDTLDDDLIIYSWDDNSYNDKFLNLRIKKDITVDDAPAWTSTLARKMLPYANTYIRNIWVNKKKGFVVVELSKGTKTKKIKVHKEKGVKFDVYAAVCAAMAIFEYGNNSKLKRDIERRVHYVESK